MASQLTDAIRASASTEGEFLRNEIFSRGATLTWNDLLNEATGEPLSPVAFVEQFVEA